MAIVSSLSCQAEPALAVPIREIRNSSHAMSEMAWSPLTVPRRIIGWRFIRTDHWTKQRQKRSEAEQNGRQRCVGETPMTLNYALATVEAGLSVADLSRIVCFRHTRRPI